MEGGQASSVSSITTAKPHCHLGVLFLLAKAQEMASTESRELYAYADTLDITTGETKQIRIIL